MYIAVIVIVIITAAIIAYRAFHATERYSLKDFFSVQFVVKSDDSNAAQINAAYTELKNRLKNIAITYYDTKTAAGKQAIQKFGIKTFPDIRVLKNGVSITKYEKKTYTVDDLKGWILGKVPNAKWT